jgi:hypothetical protein
LEEEAQREQQRTKTQTKQNEERRRDSLSTVGVYVVYWSRFIYNINCNRLMMMTKDGDKMFVVEVEGLREEEGGGGDKAGVIILRGTHEILVKNANIEDRLCASTFAG